MYTYRDVAWEGSPSSYIGVGSVRIVENVGIHSVWGSHGWLVRWLAGLAGCLAGRWFRNCWNSLSVYIFMYGKGALLYICIGSAPFIYRGLFKIGGGSFYTYGVALIYTYRDWAREGSPSL